MKFCTHLNGSSLSVAAVWSTLAVSSHAFSLAPRATQRIPVLSTDHAPFVGRTPRSTSALVLSSERDDYDDFFDDYDPSKFDSYNQNSNDNDGGVSYGGGDGGRSNSYGGPGSRGGGYFSGGGYRNRGGGNRDKQRQKGRVWEYNRDDSRDQSNVDEAVVEDLIRQRSEAKRDRDFDKADALRDTLLEEHHVGVDDKQRTWRTGVSRSGSGRGRFGRARSRDGGVRQPKQDFGPNGHDYHLSAECGPNASGFSDQEIHSLIAQRLNAKLARDFMQADSIQSDLVARGVFVHDGIKEFRHDGRAYGDFSERRNNNRGNPGRTAGSSRDRASYRKSSFSQDPEGIDEATVDRMVEERTTYKMSRDFDRADAIREGLRSQYNIQIDDRLKMWSVGGDFGEEHNARRDLAHKFASRGFIKSKSSEPLSPKNEEYVQESIDERWEAKRDRDFQTADSIRQHLLEDYQVSIDDKNKMWSVGGYFEELQKSYAPRDGKPRGVYKRRGGGNLSDEEAAQIQDLVQQRYDYKYNREFEAADGIRDNLLSEFGIIIDDRAFEWRVDSEEYAPAETGNLSESEIAEVAEKLQQRVKFRQQREYDMADSVLDDIRNTYGVTVDDRLKEWKVEGEQRASSDNFDRDLDAILSEEEDEGVAEETTSIESDSDDEVMESDDDDDDDDTEVMELDEEDDDVDDDEESSSLTEEELSKLTIPILKEKLRGAGLPVSGKKAELVARLLTSP